MSGKEAQQDELARIAAQGTLLAGEGREVKKSVWENGVYWGTDGYVYHMTCEQRRGGAQIKVEGKRSVGEYLRWVDGLFRPGELPSEANAIHYRAAKKLRELL
ncbi:MAG TPA: hypothetical protein VNO70_01420 [Blastocatellia bacterium]|nr:hypothetical protein [Blastocatellia bacterium]